MALKQTVRLISPFLLSFSLIACGGGGGFGSSNGSSGSSSDGTGSASNPNTGTVPAGINSKCTTSRLGEQSLAAGLVTALDTYDEIRCTKKLTPAEIAFIGKFENIKQLELSGEDIDLAGLPVFPKLKEFKSWAPPSYPTTFSDLSELSKQPLLEKVDILGHAITDLSPLASIITLTTVEIGGSRELTRGILTDASPLQSLVNLKKINLSVNGLKNFNFVSNLDSLEDLILGSNRIEAVSNLSGLQNLTTLSLAGNKVSDLSPLRGNNSLRTLSLVGNRIDDISPLTGLTNLTTLSLNNNCIDTGGVNLLPPNLLRDAASTFGTQEEDCSVFDDRDPQLIQLGAGSGETFSKGGLEVAIPTLTDGGKTAIIASLVGPTGNYTDRVATVTFTSDCIANATSSITGPIVTSNGRATVEYTVKGCTIEDEVTATTSIDGFDFSATTIITIVPAAIGSMAFESSTPSTIGIKGIGLNETSAVKFVVKDKQGNPVRNRQVNFSLNTSVGGITLDPVSALSDDDGIVETTVQSGTVATTVRVTATVDEEPSIKTQSEGLSISTGIADQNSFSLSASTTNPEGLFIDGAAVNISVLAADHFNNPVPDGTAIYFTTEGGVIDPECLTVKGGCSVEWRSSSPRPDNGRVTILATMLGEESFVDSTGNGLLDDDPDKFIDLAEAFLDKNENEIFDEGEDEPRDFNGNGQWDDKDGQYNGVLCNTENVINLCSSEKNTYVRDDLVLIMSGHAENIDLSPSLLDASDGFATTTVTISDRNGQAIPQGSTIEFSMIGGGSILSEKSYTMLRSTVPLSYGIIIQGQEVELGTATFFSVKVTAPSGITINKQFPVIMKTKQIELPPLNAANDFGVTSADTEVTVSVLNNDNNTGTVQVISVSPVGIADAAAGIASIVGTSSINFVPTVGFSGTANFNYTIGDDEGRTASATLSISVSELPPLNSEDDFATTAANTPLTVSVLDNDNNSGTIQITSVTPVSTADAAAGDVSVAGSNISFIPATGFSGTANFKYSIEDDEGRKASANLSISVSELSALNSEDDFATTAANTPITVSVLNNDNNTGNIQITSVTPVGVIDAAAGTANVAGSSISFVPATGFSGTANYKYTIEDDEGRIADAIVSISVTEQTPLNAEDDFATTTANTPITLFVLDNDINTGSVQLSSVSPVGLADAAAGTVNIVGNSINFNPATDFTGIATYKYTISGGAGLTAEANIIISVTAAPAAP